MAALGFQTRSFTWLESLWQDMRFGMRVLRKSPGITITGTLSLALGLGATTAMFSLLDSLLFKALPVPESQQLTVVTRISDGAPDQLFTYPSFVRLHELSRTVDLFAHSNDRAELSEGDARRKVDVAVVSEDFFRILKIQPTVGRLLAPGDDKLNSPSARSVVISYRLWQDLFQGDPAVSGKKILLDKAPFVVAGVAPKTFFGVEVGEYADITLSFAGERLLRPRNTMFDCKACYWLNVMGRVKPNLSGKQAEAGLGVAWTNTLRDTIPENYSDRYKAAYYAERVAIEPGAAGLSSLRSQFAKPLYLLLAMTGTILLISCFNVANLLVTRSLARQRELAVRLSIGASRTRLTRQLLTESALLSVLGLAGGFAVYQACIRGLLRFLASGGRQIYLDSRVDIRLLLFVLGVTMLTIAIFGLVPALRATRRRLSGTLAEHSQMVAANSTLGKVILAAQLGLSLTLIMGAVLLGRSLYELRTFDAGIRRDHLIVASADFGNAIPKPDEQERFFDAMLERVRSMPGVRSASVSYILPLGGSSAQQDYTAEGFVPNGNSDYGSYYNIVSPDYFETIGTQLLLGRDFNERDGKNSPKAAVVNESFAKHYWNTANPLGKRFRGVESKEWITVVGLVRDAKYRDLKAAAPRTAYFPLKQQTTSVFSFSQKLEVWTSIDPVRVAPGIRDLVPQISHGVSMKLEMFSDLIDGRLVYERLVTVLSICFGCIGMMISAIGVYGIAAYSVTRRTKEVGIRMALGATAAGILKLVFGEQAVPVCAGLGAGITGALLLGRFLRSWLFGVGATDFASLAVSVVLLTAVTALATLIPARRAAKMEPLRSLRYE